MGYAAASIKIEELLFWRLLIAAKDNEAPIRVT
jgi:hypothetical protein